MGGRTGRDVLRVLVGSVTLMLAIGSGSPTSAAPAAKTSQFAADGTITQTSVQAPPNVDGAIGGFVLHSEGATPPAVNNAADGNGDLTIYYRSDTGYHQCDANGENCHKATRDQVLAAGTHVKVMGRYYVANGQYNLLAYDVWTPTKAPPPAAPPSGPNPQPKTLNDYTNGNLFGVRARIVATKVDVLGGFKVGEFDAANGYGCGNVPGCKVQRIAAAHADRLTIDPRGVETTYYISDDGGCTYKKTTDSYSVIYRRGSVDGVRVTGRYTWGGLDWVFTAGKVWTPAPKAAELCPAPQPGRVDVFSASSQQDAGTYDSDAETWTGSKWSGTNGVGDFGAGSTVMTLDWVLVPGGWEFSGTYSVSAGPTDPTSIGGDIQGLATPQASDPTHTQWDISAQLTVTQTAGKYAGWSGDGQWTSFGTGDWSTPPSAQQGTFRWYLAAP